MSNRSILVIDDSMVFCRLTKKTLEGFGFDVKTARNGIEALKSFQEEIPVVALVDLEMPEMNGFQLIAKMKSDDKLKNIPIVVVTAKSSPEDLEVGKKLPIEAYLTKPIDESVLLDKIKACMPKKESLEKPEIVIPEGKKDPIYSVDGRCFVCGASNIQIYLVKTKSQNVNTDYFSVACYEEQGDFIQSDYQFMNTIACSKCLTAGNSADVEFFAGPDNRKSPGSREKRLLGMIEADFGSRMQLLSEITGEIYDESERAIFFDRMRSPKAALAISLLEANCLETLEPKSFKSQHTKIAPAYLKAAYFAKMDDNPEEEKKHLNTALGRFLKANDEGPSMKVNFMIALLYQAAGDMNNAKVFLSEIGNAQVAFAENNNPKVANVLRNKAKNLLDELRYG